MENSFCQKRIVFLNSLCYKHSIIIDIFFKNLFWTFLMVLIVGCDLNSSHLIGNDNNTWPKSFLYYTYACQLCRSLPELTFNQKNIFEWFQIQMNTNEIFISNHKWLHVLYIFLSSWINDIFFLHDAWFYLHNFI